MKAKTLHITADPGYYLCIPYIPKGTFESIKEFEGEDKLSEIIYVGDEIKDSFGILRKPLHKKGEIIIHNDTNKTFTKNYQKYRYVHFSEVHGTVKGEK